MRPTSSGWDTRGTTGPSSVQCKGCRAGCALISCREGNLGWTTSRYELGLVVDVHDPAAVHHALLELVQGGQQEWNRYKENGLQYVRQRSGDDFGDAVVRMAEESVMPVEPAMHGGSDDQKFSLGTKAACRIEAV